MNPDTSISIAALCKGSTIMMLFVVCSCLFINVRSQQVTKRQQIQDLKHEQASLRVTIQKVEADIKRNLAPRVLESRLQAHNSTLARVNVEQTEELVPEMTASR